MPDIKLSHLDKKQQNDIIKKYNGKLFCLKRLKQEDPITNIMIYDIDTEKDLFKIYYFSDKKRKTFCTSFLVEDDSFMGLYFVPLKDSSNE